VLVSHGNIQVAGEVADLLAAHRMLTGPATESARYTKHWNVVHASSSTASQLHLLVRYDNSNPVPPGWEARSVTLEELTLAYLRESSALPGPSRGLGAGPSEVTR
jgi:ABC-2 type transport system ATP-binding protein